MSRAGLVGAAFGVAVAAWSADAHAVNNVTSPFINDPVIARIGSHPSGQWIGWQSQLTGQCVWRIIGNQSGLYDDTLVFFGQSGDLIYVQDQSVDFCGARLGVPLYNGRHLDLFGGDGDNVMWSLSTGNTWIDGGTGKDQIYSGRGSAQLSGWGGDDKLWASGSGTGLKVLGGYGDDCLTISTNLTPTKMSCGEGSDRWAGPGTRPADCEATALLCF